MQIPVEMVHYGMTKTAQLAVSRGLAESVAGTGITVNSVLPGPTLSEGVAEFMKQMAGGAADADLEWLPQETILFDGARLDRRLKISLAPSSRLLATETVLFGRSARAERLSYGHLHDSWAIRIGDTLTWTDAIRLSGDIAAARARPFGFGDAAGYATVVIAGRDAPTHLDAARAIAAASPAQHSGATLVNGIVILRLMDADAARLRTAVAQAAAALRAIVMGRAAVLPRAWSL